MSAERKFQIVRKRQVGGLPKPLQERWRALVARRERLSQMRKNLDADVRKFYRRVARLLVDEVDLSEASRGLRLTEDGTLYEMYCECPSCQADIHGVSVSVIVEEMIKQDLIHPDEINSVRQRAMEIDSSKKTAEKKNLLFN